MLNRRQFIAAAGASLSLHHLPLLAADASAGQSRFVWVLLRGAMDGMSALVPYGDSNYAQLRQQIAIPAPAGSDTGLKLDGHFALHPQLAAFANWYRQGQLLAYPAVASPYRERSHFDGQNVLENSGLGAYEQSDGWLNRAMSSLMPAYPEFRGLAVGSAVPLSMQGAVSVESWSPSQLAMPDDDIYARLARLYDADDLLSARLQSLQKTREEVMAMDMQASRAGSLESFRQMVEAAGKLMAADGGPQIAALELGGWDTHANQGAVNGRLATQLRGLNQGLEILAQALADRWSDTRIVVMTEFGRTAAVNGTGGTDHGTASAAFVLGGAVAGGKVAGEWPGLAASDLYQNRDLRPTLDSRAILKGELHRAFGLSEAQLAELVFPGSANIQPI